MAITEYIGSTLIGGRVAGITGRPSDGVIAGGYSAWIDSITGSEPKIQQLPGGKVKLLLTDRQILQMRKWFDKQLWSSFKPKEKQPSLQIEFNPVFVPWALKYGIPLIVSAYILGWVSKTVIQ